MPEYKRLLTSLDGDYKMLVEALFERFSFTESEKQEIVTSYSDLRLWGEEPYKVDKALFSNKDGRDRKRFIESLRRYMKRLRREDTDYSAFSVDWKPKIKRVIKEDYPLILGRCPCPKDGEETRCCNLTTLDITKQCAFNCAYCSVQAFYDEENIVVKENLESSLLSLDLKDIWHIGTGQASDSLLFDNHYGEIDALASFAKAHQDIIIELKSKNKASCFKSSMPKNLVFTWSLNAPSVTSQEEHFTASLEDRLGSARRAADSNLLVGFHLHPLVHFLGWKEEYNDVVKRITSSFHPDEVMMISFGTLTYTKSVMKRMREEGRKSKITKMEMEKLAGKYTYPRETRRELYSYLYSIFPAEWKKSVFFYLCLEDPTLWDECLGYSHPSNIAFEEAMKKSYLSKVEAKRGLL